MADETTVPEPVEPEQTPAPDEPEPEPTPEPEPEPDTEPESRCDAVQEVGGVLYRCALEPEHRNDHRYQPIDADEPESDGGKDAVDKAIPRLEAEAARHAKRVIEIMGRDSEGLIVCELCLPIIPGYRWDSAPDEATIQRVRTAIGMPDLSNFRPSSTEAVCDDCAGLGKVRTGSSVPKYETATCDACAGKGYRETRPRLNEQPAPAALEPSANGEAPVYDDGVKRDMFGTPETDPDYNLMPSVRARPTDYWQTHRE